MRVSKMIGSLLILICCSAKAQDPVNGKALFDANCMACHSIGGGKIVGPDLKDVDKRRTEEWIISFVKHPMQMINSGDEVAKKLFEEHGKIPMPDQAHLKDEEIKNIIAFVKEKGGAPAQVAEKPKTEAANPKTAEASVVLGWIEYTLISFVALGCLVFFFLFYTLVRLMGLMKK